MEYKKTVLEKKLDNRLNEIVAKIAGHLNPEKIFLFGSRVRNDHEPESDYDFLIIHDSAKSKREIKLEIRRLLRPQNFSMDLFVLTNDEFESQKTIANTIAREVFETGQVVYE